MATGSERFDVYVDDRPWPSSVIERYLWPVCLGMAWLTFELTANATLSLTCACLKFGVNDFLTGRWLWRTEPDRPRGRACGLFFVASGVWKTAIVPLLTAGTIAIVWAIIAPRAMQNAPTITAQLFSALYVGMWAAGVLILVAGVAVAITLRARSLVWVHPNVHGNRRDDCWPPQFDANAETPPNQASLILLTAVFAAILVAPLLTLQAVQSLNLPDALRLICSLVIIFGYPVLGAMTIGLLRSKLIANSPWQCWPESIGRTANDDIEH